MTIKKITALHAELEQALFFINPKLDYIEVIEKLTEFANLIHALDEGNDKWLYIGDCSSATPPDLLIGAYWHLTEWHSGQWSDSYAAMCAIGEVFHPGMSNGPEEESSEHYVYTALNTMAEKHSENKSVAHS